MLELAVVEAAQKPGGRTVVEMAETACDALAQFLWVTAHAQHLGIVIAFQNQRIATAQHGLDMPGGTTNISALTIQPLRAGTTAASAQKHCCYRGWPAAPVLMWYLYLTR